MDVPNKVHAIVKQENVIAFMDFMEMTAL